MAEDPLAAARQALDRGEYGRVLRLLEPLAEEHPPVTATGAGLRLLMATALMGQGHTDRAADCCRALRSCPDSGLRAQARDLLMVLEAPQLRRPRSWSLTLPEIAGSEPLEGRGAWASRQQRPAAEEPPPPPVGPTRPPRGFALLVALLLVLLTWLLGGCMEVRTELRFDGPGRLQISHQLRGGSPHPAPWQRRFTAALEAGSFRSVSGSAGQLLRTPVLPAEDALGALAGSLQLAAEFAGMELPPPLLRLEERNWLLGVRQHLLVDLDLRAIQPLPGLDLALQLAPVLPGAVLRAEPLAALPLAAKPRNSAKDAAKAAAGGQEEVGAGPALRWPLQPGRRNVLELSCWRWSGLGVGAGAIGLALLLVLTLQRVRRSLGFGLPELPA
jgi:hypothetical protein